MGKKILTVSVAAYNVQETLGECLKPFVYSKYKDELEILIINDGSTDRTTNIAQKFVSQYPDMFMLITKKNAGWGSTLNTGIKKASGKYFKQLDGDDYFSYENLDCFIEFLKSSDADMVYSPFVIFSDKSKAIIRVAGIYKEPIPMRELMHLGEISDFVPAMHSLCVRTDILKLKNINITEHCFYTDVEFVLKVCNNCSTLAFFDLPVYYYRLARTGQSMSIQGVRKHYKDHLKMLKTMLNYEDKYVTDINVNKIFHMRLLNACEFQYIFFFALKGNKKEREELVEFDSWLKNTYPNYFYQIKNQAVKLLRKTKFHGYKIIGHIQTQRDRDKRINIFEGC